MPYNPMTGEFDYGGESYNAPTFGTGMAMEGMGAVGANVPLAFRMMENVPGVTAMALHNARRFSNTMFRGGFLDVTAGGTPVSQGILSKTLDRGARRVGAGGVVNARRLRKAQELGATVGGIPQKATAKSFLFGGKRFPGGVPADKTPLFRPSRVTNFTARPRIFNRMGSVTQLGGVANQGFYTPFQGGSFLESMFGKRARQAAVSRGAVRSGSNERMFSGGVLGRMSTMSRAYSLGRRLEQIEDVATRPGVSARRTARLEKRINKINTQMAGLDRNIATLQYAGRGTGRATASTITATGSTRVGMTEIFASERLRLARAGSVSPETEAFIRNNRLRAISDSSSGFVSRSITEYMGTMLDPSQFKGTRAFLALEKNITNALGRTLPTAADGTVSLSAGRAMKVNVGKFLAGETVDDIGKFGVKSLTRLSGTALAAGEKKLALKLAGATGARALGLAIPGLNVIGTASLVYDLTKMAAMGVVAAGNFAKDAVKSMQGSIHKPVFGMGYQDTEVAATSRARGVMAIQNSRLNARSMLGSEASMMAAHFG